MKKQKTEGVEKTQRNRVEEEERKGILSTIRDEAKFRQYINDIFSDEEYFSEKRMLRLARGVIFVLLMFVELLILLQHVERILEGGSWVTFVIIVLLLVVFTVAETAKDFIYPTEENLLVYYVLEVAATCGLLFLTGGAYSLILFILTLTQFYFGARTIRATAWMFFAALLLYAVSYFFQVLLMRGDVWGIEILRESAGTLVALICHFLSVQLILAFYRQYLRLHRTLAELDASKKKLESAYSVVAEVTALEERQRIAKEIHDTAGHSLTTVIMQTEMAKRMIDTNPQEAKIKIVAANLQARHTLERLRESVHLLSGTEEGLSLKMEMENIIHESSDGTDIRIRAEIEDISVSSAKRRFLCNSLKEGLANGLRHGNATAFWVELKTEEEKIRFLLSDNGKGLDGKKAVWGYGLTSMRARARTFGGEMGVTSEPNEGFELQITLPIDASNEKKA